MFVMRLMTSAQGPGHLQADICASAVLVSTKVCANSLLSVREMIWVDSYFMVLSYCTVLRLGKGIRDGGNALSGESRHLRRGKTCKDKGEQT